MLKGEVIELAEEILFVSEKYEDIQKSLNLIKENFEKLDEYIKNKSVEVWRIVPNETIFRLDDDNLEKIIIEFPKETEDCLKKSLEILVHYGLLELFELDFEVECI